ncbi:hypothetical protein E9993_16040 [Labilibacter sediminis]|nr:hypothetical protein E9993_16040 [Labilibacter sediminis]
MVQVEYGVSNEIRIIRLRGILRKTGIYKLNKVISASKSICHIILDLSDLTMDLSMRDIYFFIDTIIQKVESYNVERIALVGKKPYQTVLMVLLKEKLMNIKKCCCIFFDANNATNWLIMYPNDYQINYNHLDKSAVIWYPLKFPV